MKKLILLAALSLTPVVALDAFSLFGSSKQEGKMGRLYEQGKKAASHPICLCILSAFFGACAMKICPKYNFKFKTTKTENIQ